MLQLKEKEREFGGREREREQKREKGGDTGDRVILDDIMRDREVEWREISTVKEHMM